jgi:hypothetical protein
MNGYHFVEMLLLLAVPVGNFTCIFPSMYAVPIYTLLERSPFGRKEMRRVEGRLLRGTPNGWLRRPLAPAKKYQQGLAASLLQSTSSVCIIDCSIDLPLASFVNCYVVSLSRYLIGLSQITLHFQQHNLQHMDSLISRANRTVSIHALAAPLTASSVWSWLYPIKTCCRLCDWLPSEHLSADGILLTWTWSMSLIGKWIHT